MRVKPATPESAAERIFVIGGTVIAVSGMLKRSTAGGLGLMLLGGALVAKGLQTRHHNIDLAHGRIQPKLPETHGEVVEQTIVIDRPKPQVYGYWRNLENLPRFMSNLVSVREFGEGKSSWVLKGPKGATITWDAETVADSPNEMIFWRSLPGAVVRNEGAVYFHQLPNDRTEVRLYMEFHPPLGGLGLKVANWMGDDPKEQIRQDLQRFKEILEGIEPSRK